VRAFGARAYHQVRTDHVCRLAGIGKGTLYRYFPSKEELYLAVVEEAFEDLVRRLEAEHAAPAGPAAALGRMLEAIVDTFARHLPVVRLLHQDEARLFLRKRQVIRTRRARIAQLLGEVLQAGAAAGAFRKLDPVLGPSMLIGMVWGTTLNHADEAPSEVLAARVADLSLHGLLAPGPPAAP
jgi:AcrR family transcriptional regulator